MADQRLRSSGLYTGLYKAVFQNHKLATNLRHDVNIDLVPIQDAANTFSSELQINN